MLDPSREHQGLGLRAGPRRHAARPRGSVMKTGLALSVETSHPAVRTLAGNAHCPGDMSDRHVLVTDSLHE
jgi:hypothetical protein